MAAPRSALRQKIKGLSKRAWVASVLKTLVAAYMWLIYVTARKSFEIHPETQLLLDKKNPFLLGNWHGRLFLFAPFWRDKGTMSLAVITSPHTDGQIVGGGAERLGIIALRGTKGGKGGAAAMRGGLSALKNGSCLIINPDGPSGPRQVMGPGTAALAQLSDAPFVAATYSCASGRLLTGQWDQTLLPRLFSKVTFQLGEPIYVSKDEAREEVCAQLGEIMNQQLWSLDAAYMRDKILPQTT